MNTNQQPKHGINRQGSRLPGRIRPGRWPRLRRGRGLSLFSTVLALGLLGVLVLGVGRWFEVRAFENRQQLAADQLARVFAAVRDLTSRDFPITVQTLQAASPNGIRELPFPTLVQAGVLPAGFSRTNALGQTYRIFRRLQTTTVAGTTTPATPRVDLLVATQTPPGDVVRYNFAALDRQANGIAFGLVLPGSPGSIRGPGVDGDVSAYQATAPGALGLGELAAIGTLTREGITGSALYRVALPGEPSVNTMETDLDLGGHDLTGGGTIHAARVEVLEDITVLGGFEVAGTLHVGILDVREDAHVQGTLTATGVAVTNDLQTGSLEITGDALVGGRLSAADSLSAGVLDVSGTLAADQLRTDTLKVTERITSTSVVADSIQANTVTADNIRAAESITGESGQFRSLDVGGCRGC